MQLVTTLDGSSVSQFPLIRWNGEEMLIQLSPTARNFNVQSAERMLRQVTFTCSLSLAFKDEENPWQIAAVALKYAWCYTLTTHLHSVLLGRVELVCWLEFPQQGSLVSETWIYCEAHGTIGSGSISFLEMFHNLAHKLDNLYNIFDGGWSALCALNVRNDVRRWCSRGPFLVEIFKNWNYTSLDREFDADGENRIFRIF